MQTQLDPFEVTSRLPQAPREAPATLDLKVEEDVAPAPMRPAPDSSGRLRCWCSED